MAETGQKWSLIESATKVRLPIGKRTIEPTAAAHCDHSVGYVGFLIPKGKKLARSDFVAC